MRDGECHYPEGEHPPYRFCGQFVQDGIELLPLSPQPLLPRDRAAARPLQRLYELSGRAMTAVLHGDCLAILPTLPPDSFNSCVTDPPYHLVSIVKRMSAPNAAPVGFGSDGRYRRLSGGFMGKQWDGGDIAARVETWAEVYRVLKPGAHLVAFGGTRTYHRMACAIEDAGFEIRDCIQWIYGSGFPKSHDVSKTVDATILHGGSNPRRMKLVNEQRRRGVR